MTDCCPCCKSLSTRLTSVQIRALMVEMTVGTLSRTEALERLNDIIDASGMPREKWLSQEAAICRNLPIRKPPELRVIEGGGRVPRRGRPRKYKVVGGMSA